MWSDSLAVCCMQYMTNVYLILKYFTFCSIRLSVGYKQNDVVLFSIPGIFINFFTRVLYNLFFTASKPLNLFDRISGFLLHRKFSCTDWFSMWLRFWVYQGWKIMVFIFLSTKDFFVANDFCMSLIYVGNL